MLQKLSWLLLLLCFFLCGTAVTVAQCGSAIKIVIQNCGGGPHCGGSIMQPTCEGVGTACEQGTGRIGFGCCGLMVLEPGACRSAKAAPGRELLPSQEFMELREALALRKKAFASRSEVMIASCAPDENAFNEWLRSKLRQQQQ